LIHIAPEQLAVCSAVAKIVSAKGWIISKEYPVETRGRSLSAAGLEFKEARD